MNKLDYKTPHIKYISHKTVKDADGKEHVERVFTLIPVKAKDKPKLSKEEVLAAKKAKKEAPYVSLGMSKKIPPSQVKKDKDGKIIPKPDIWSSTGLAVLKEYRRLKEIFDKETTEVITLPNGFKKEIKIKLDFKPLPSMKLSPEERKTRMDEHKKASKAKRTVRNARVAAFKQNSKPYVQESYVSDTKARKERQKVWQTNHNKVINKLIDTIRARKENTKLKIVKVYKMGEDNYIRKMVKSKVPFDKGMEVIQKIVNKNKAKDAVHVFGINRKSNITEIGMKIAA